MTPRSALTGPSVWLGSDMAKSSRWLRDLTPAMVDELDRALERVQDRPWHAIRREDFPLDRTRALAEDMAEELENGCGIVKLRGVPVDRWGIEDLRRIYFALGAHVGTPVFQNRRGELMRDIRDEGGDVGKRYGQIETGQGGTFLSSYARTLTNGRLRFHTDRTDVVGLLCVAQARAGGVSKLVSTPMVHNVMRQRRPELLECLFQNVWRSRHGEESETPDAVYPLPVFGVRDGRFTSHYSLTYIEAAQMVDGVPKLTAQQREAIDLLMELSEELCFEMTLEPGDLQFINSHVTYHGRTPFEDDAAAGKSRLLLRLWLTMGNNRALPAGHEVLWRNIEAGQPRGGIGQVAA
jgi:hypothetical protein